MYKLSDSLFLAELRNQDRYSYRSLAIWEKDVRGKEVFPQTSLEGICITY